MRRGSRRTHGYLIAAVTLASLFALAGGVLLIFVHLYGFDRVDATWQRVRPAAVAAKWSAMILVIARWRSLAGWLGRRFRLPTEQVERLQAMRWRAAAALLALELLIGQNLLGRLMAA